MGIEICHTMRHTVKRARSIKKAPAGALSVALSLSRAFGAPLSVLVLSFL